jgi:hypothetical protein
MVNWQGILFLGFMNERWKDGNRTNPKLFVVTSKVQMGGGNPFCLLIHVVIKVMQIIYVSIKDHDAIELILLA